MTHIKRWIPARLWHAAADGYRRIRQSDLIRDQLPAVVSYRTHERLVALTFDDGPHPSGTPGVLEVLARHGVHATFFVVGRNVEAHPGLARAIVAAGHALGNHTQTHPSLRRCSARESWRQLRQCQESIRRLTGENPNIMRPPYGAQNVRSFLVARLLGFRTIHWSTTGGDYQGEDARTVAERIVRHTAPGSVILLHDNLEPPRHQDRWLEGQESLWDRSATIEALDSIIVALRRDGYRFVTLPELMAASSPNVQRRFRSVTTTVASLVSAVLQSI